MRVLAIGLLALVFTLNPAFAQTVVAVTPTFTQQMLSELIQGMTAIALAAVPILAGAAVVWLRSKWRLAGVLITQSLLDKMILAIQNQIRAEAEKVKGRLISVPGSLSPNGSVVLSSMDKQAIAATVAPKIAADFPDTLKRLGKDPATLKDMVLGHVEPALNPVAPVVEKPVVIPAVMARS